MKLSEIEPGVTYAVVAQSMRQNDPTQFAVKVKVEALCPGGRPPMEDEDLSWRHREQYKKLKVYGKVAKSSPYRWPQYDLIGDDTVYFEPRKVLSTWKDYEAARKAEAERQERIEAERQEQGQEYAKLGKALRERCEERGLVTEPPYPSAWFDHSAYGDGSGRFEVNASPEQIIELLDKLPTPEEIESLRHYLKDVPEGEDGGIDTLRERGVI